MSDTKPFDISKRVVWEAYHRVKANKGAAGIDGESISKFDENRNSNLYRVWNRMASGSYFPPPVRAVSIPKKTGGERILGVPTVSDRIAQTVVAQVLEPRLEAIFHPNSYGYRRGKSAHDALSVTRKRCWERNWVLEYDIQGLFDNIKHDLLLKALRHHCDERWVLLYVERWLTAPMQLHNGELVPRSMGTPQGGPLSPILANLYMHYALDHWLVKFHPSVPFCRYADDGILHCNTLAEAEQLHHLISRRLLACGLALHPDKTRIVYCKDSNRTGIFENIHFDFLGHTFRPRVASNRSGQVFTSFLPAISRSALVSIRQRIRSWRLSLKSTYSLQHLANWLNPVVRGWFGYYGRFYRSSLRLISLRLDLALLAWARRKFKRFRAHKIRAIKWLRRLQLTQPELFAHWYLCGRYEAGTMGAQ